MADPAFAYPRDSFNLDDIPDVAFEDPNDDFMQYLETLDIPGTTDAALAEFGAAPGLDLGRGNTGVDPGEYRAGAKRSVIARGSEVLQAVSHGSPSHDDTDGTQGNTHDDKLTKMREKNRQAQARFRKRQKVPYAYKFMCLRARSDPCWLFRDRLTPCTRMHNWGFYGLGFFHILCFRFA